MNVRTPRRWLPLSALALALAACSSFRPPPGRAAARCKLKSGRISHDTTLYRSCSPYTIKRGGIDVVYSAVLTIQPGVEVRFADGDWLEIGADGTHGARLVARGTKKQPIVLTSARPHPRGGRSWFGLWFNKGTIAGSVLSHAVIRDAGGDNKDITPTLVEGCLTVTDVPAGAVTIDDVLLDHCRNAGLVLRRSQPRLRRLRLQDMKRGVLLDGVSRKFVKGAISYRNVVDEVAEGASSRPPQKR